MKKLKTYFITILTPDGDREFSTVCNYFYQAVDAANDFLRACPGGSEIIAVIDTFEFNVDITHDKPEE